LALYRLQESNYRGETQVRGYFGCATGLPRDVHVRATVAQEELQIS